LWAIKGLLAKPAGHLLSMSFAFAISASRDRPPLPQPVGRTTGHLRVTEPPKIFPYYRLSRSTWPLSNNKELLSRFRRVKPGKSHTTGSLICAKPTRRRDQSTTLHYITLHYITLHKRFTSSTLLQTRFFMHKSKHDQNLNSGK
jgi:hypothetical protein